MSDVRVYIATTAGPVAVERITEEDPEVNSVICLAGKAVALPISGAYDDFVRNPTGVVQRHFGHPAYRVDVAGKVDEGYSWQFAVLAAHALRRAGRLAGPDDRPATILLATGEIDRDLALHPVDGVAEKINRLERQLPNLADGAMQLLIAVPAGAEAPWQSRFTAEAAPDGVNVEVLAAASANDLLRRLGLAVLETPEVVGPEPETAAPPPGRRARVAALAAVFALAAMAAAAGGAVYAPEIKAWLGAMSGTGATGGPAPVATTLPEPPSSRVPSPTPTPEPVAAVPEPAQSEPPPSKPAPPRKPAFDATPKPPTDRVDEARLPAAPPPAGHVLVEIDELRAPAGYTCRDVRQGRVTAVRLPARRRDNGHFLPSPQRNLCTVEIRAASSDGASYLFGRYQRWTQTPPTEGPADKTIDLGPRRAHVRWTVDIPDRLRRGALFKISIFSAAHEFRPKARLLARLDRIRPGGDSMRKLRRRLEENGIMLIQRRFRIVPERLLRDRPPPANLRLPRPPSGNRFPPPPRG